MSSVLTFVRPISRRGQVVVPKDVRAHLRIGDEMVFEVHDDRVEIRSPDVRFLDAFLDVRRRRKSPAPDALKALLVGATTFLSEDKDFDRVPGLNRQPA